MTSKAKILLVEDESVLQKLYSRILNDAGFELTISENGKEALECLKELLPDIIISDIMMPEMDGFEFRKNLKNDARFDTIPFCFLTSRTGEEDIITGLDLGADDYISKITSPRILVKKIETLLQRKNIQQQKLKEEFVTAASSASMQLIPDLPPNFEGYDLQQWHHSSEGIPGGDFIDYIPISEKKLFVAIGDTMGKQWGAWMYAQAYIAYLRSALRGLSAEYKTKSITPSQLLQKFNELLYSDAKTSEIICTVGIIQIETPSSTLVYANASHIPPLYFRKAGNSISLIENEGYLVGVHKNVLYQDTIINMDIGDAVLLYTDGVTELKSKEKELYGIERLQNQFHLMMNNKPTSIISGILGDMDAFTEGKLPIDDATLVSILKT